MVGQPLYSLCCGARPSGQARSSARNPDLMLGFCSACRQHVVFVPHGHEATPIEKWLAEPQLARAAQLASLERRAALRDIAWGLLACAAIVATVLLIWRGCHEAGQRALEGTSQAGYTSGPVRLNGAVFHSPKVPHGRGGREDL